MTALVQTGSVERSGEFLRPRLSNRASVLASVVLVPVFVHVGPAGLTLGESNRLALRSDGVDLPIAVLAYPFLLLWLLRDRHRTSTPPGGSTATALVAVYVMVQVVAWGFGVVIGEGLDAVGSLFVVQAILPTTYFFVGRRLAKRDLALVEYALTCAFRSVLVAAAAYFAVTAVRGTDPVLGMQDAIGPFVNSKALRYFPSVVALAAMWSFMRSHETVRRRVDLALAVAGVAYVVGSHARSSYLIVVLVAAVVAAGGSPMLVAARRRLAIGALASGLVFVVLMAGSPSGDVLPRSLVRLIGLEESAATSSALHGSALMNGLREGLSSPLGRSYRADVDQTLVGAERSVNQIANSESQFSEAALRAGPLSFLSLLSLVVLGFSRARRLAKRLGTSTAAFLLGSGLALWLVVGLVQLNMTEAYIAPVSWFILGCVWASPSQSSTSQTGPKARSQPAHVFVHG